MLGYISKSQAFLQRRAKETLVLWEKHLDQQPFPSSSGKPRGLRTDGGGGMGVGFFISHG